MDWTDSILLIRSEGGTLHNRAIFGSNADERAFMEFTRRIQEPCYMEMVIRRQFPTKSDKQMRFYRKVILKNLYYGLDDIGWNGLGTHVDPDDGLERPVPMSRDNVHRWAKQAFAKMHREEFPDTWADFTPFSLADFDMDQMRRFIDFIQEFCWLHGIVSRID